MTTCFVICVVRISESIYVARVHCTLTDELTRLYVRLILSHVTDDSTSITGYNGNEQIVRLDRNETRSKAILNQFSLYTVLGIREGNHTKRM